MTNLPATALRFALLDGALAELGAAYDAKGVYPTESAALLVRSGMHRTFAPPAAGGEVFRSPQEENRALFDCLRMVGRADLSLGRIFEGHVNALKLFAWYGSDRQHKRLARDLAAGRLFGVWATEPPPGVTLAKDPFGWRLEGAKRFATGAGSLHYAIVTARPDDGPRRLAVVAANIAERADLSGWTMRGMRATASGAYDVSGMRPADDDLLGDPGVYDLEPRFTAGAWRFLAVQLGGVEALLTETRKALSEAARADPLQRAKFGEAVAATRGAGLWVREAADRAADDHPDAKPFVQMTRGVVERAALDVMEISARLIGTRSAVEGGRIDKIIRDLSLYLRQAGPDHARDEAAKAWLDHDVWGEGDELW
ncbi:acyl-CoA dehydrogenase family protein [Methylopila sp. Yamaguchi]|uniref:acyl-CoA dehydrogenase family protein n=1 Tax=Methylopila sp. Yamaguchi TaxID=1437817 RepID=UPI000CC84B8E|nr:acyl-CoA dehydrogenase family protein [Methylopila sp. Yamaguchi]GBD48865.1 acyl-CoA dehydrogenase [Methylopila sp. Yamaguchi]